MAVLSLSLMFFDLKDRLEQQIVSYESLLDMFSAVYVPDLVNGYQLQLDALSASLAPQRIERGEAPLPEAWALLHGSRLHNRHFYFYNLLHDRLDVYPKWSPPPGFVAQQRPWWRFVDPTFPTSRWIGPYTEARSGERVMTAVRRIRGAAGQVQGLLMVDMPLAPLQQALERVIGRNPLALQVYDRDSKTLVVGSNRSQQAVNADLLLKAETGANVWRALENGIVLFRRLDVPHWDAVLYLPPQQVRAIMAEAAPRYLIPLFGLVLFWALGMYALHRVLLREQQLLSDEMGRLVQEERIQQAPWTRHDQLWFVGEQLGVVQRVARKLDEATRASTEDVLTGMPNRRAFTQELADRWQTGAAFWLLAIDIDHFKHLNDAFGHLFGDSVLQRLTRTLASTDWPLKLYRTGGDELLVFLEDTVPVGTVLDDLLQRVRALHWREAGAMVSISIGAAHSREVAEREALLALADARLYRSKRQRNCACWQSEAT